VCCQSQSQLDDVSLDQHQKFSDSTIQNCTTSTHVDQNTIQYIGPICLSIVQRPTPTNPRTNLPTTEHCIHAAQYLYPPGCTYIHTYIHRYEIATILSCIDTAMPIPIPSIYICTYIHQIHTYGHISSVLTSKAQLPTKTTILFPFRHALLRSQNLHYE